MGNLLGEPFKDYVDAQINVRQDVHGKANRSLQELQYLNSKNAWIKLASGTSFDETRLELLRKNGNPLIPENFPPGMDLARENVLFNGLSKNQVKMPGGSNYQQRSGITGVNRAYGVGGTEQGYSPMPGIIDANIKDLNKGSIKKATINLKAHNRNQFDIIDALYLRVGYSVMLEWGVDKYLKSPENGGGPITPTTEYTLENMGTTLIDRKFWREFQNSSYNEILPAIEELRKKYQGNYDGMFGVISNFSWTFEADGSYNIKLEIMSQGDVIESLKANLPKKDKDGEVVNEYDKLARAKAAENEVGDVDSFFALYPGLEQIIEDWYEGVKAGKGTFGYDPISLKTPSNFTSLDIASYEENSSTSPLKNKANISQAKQLLSNAEFGSSLKQFIKTINQNQEENNNPNYTSLDYLGKPEDLKVLGTDQIYRQKDQYTLSGWSTGPSPYINQSVEASYRKYETSQGIEEGKITGPQRLLVNRLWLIENLTLNGIKNSVFAKALSNNFAGGSKDAQFKTEVDEDATEEEKAELEAEQEVEKELEAKKDKNKINNYLYRVRNVWGGLINGEYKYLGEEGFGWIKVDSRKLGSIQNPTGTNPGKFKPIWNREVQFPIYPRPLAESLDDKGDTDSDQPNAADFIKLNISPLDKQHFIRLGVFLEYLEKKVIPRIKTGSKANQPMLLIDYHPKNNICYVIDNVISLDPNKTLVENTNFFNGKEFEKVFSQIKTYQRKTKSGYSWGNIMNIYINFARIEELFENVDEENEVSVYSILKNLATDINSSLGNINNIEPIIDKETNTVKFIDQTPIPGLEDIARELNIPFKSDKSSVKLEIFGLNPTNNTSNFVRSAGITTELSKEYTTMITIGATANGAIPGAEATAFSKWNIGITDRFKTNIVDGEAEREATLEEQNQSVLQQYLFMIERTTAKLGLTKDSEGKYIIDDEVISINRDSASNYYTYAQAETSNSEGGSIESSIGFIPFNLKLSMDGLSGIKIYNKVNVNTSFLPSNYGDTLSFIVTGVNHKLSGNEWVTNLDTLATTKDKTKQASTEDVDTEELLNGENQPQPSSRTNMGPVAPPTVEEVKTFQENNPFGIINTPLRNTLPQPEGYGEFDIDLDIDLPI